MNELLLTPEEQNDAETKGLQKLRDEWKSSIKPSAEIISGYVHDAICQAQHYKDTHPPKLDKPDGEGWWWFDGKGYGDIEERESDITAFIRVIEIGSRGYVPIYANFYLSNYYGIKLEGTWQRVSVPE